MDSPKIMKFILTLSPIVEIIMSMARVVVHDYSGHTFQFSLSRELVRRGHQVFHLYADSLETPRGNFSANIDRLEIIRVPQPNFAKHDYFRRFFQERQYGRELVRTVADIQPDVVISGNTPLEPQLRLLKYCAGARIRFVHWWQDVYSRGIAAGLKLKFGYLGVLVGRAFEKIERRIVDESDAIVAIAPSFRDLAIQWRKSSTGVHLIPNWAPIEELPLVPKVNPVSRTLDLDSTTNIVYSGTLGVKHNPQLLVRLAQRFSDHATVRLLIVSEGPSVQYIERQIQTLKLNNVRFLPFQPFEVLPDVLAAADILVVLLENEASRFSVPSKVATYMAAGRAIAACVPHENYAAKVIDHAGAGLIAATDDGEGFIAAAERLVVDSSLREAMGRAGRTFAEKEFRIEKIATAFEIPLGL